MPTAEGTFPKVGGDPLYYSEVNRFINEEFRQRIRRNKYGQEATLQLNNLNNEIIGFGIVGGSGLSTRDMYQGVTTLTNSQAFPGQTKQLPFVSGVTGSVFTSDTMWINGSANIILPYIDFEVLTSYDECNNSVVDTTLWSSGGSIRESTSVLTFSGNSFIQTANILPPTLSKISYSFFCNVGDADPAQNAEIYIAGSNIGSTLLFQIQDRQGLTDTPSMRLYGEMFFGAFKSGITNSVWGKDDKNSNFIAESNRINPGYGGSTYLKFSTSDNLAVFTLQHVRWHDRNSVYNSTGSIEVSNNGGVNWNVATNGQPYVFGTFGSMFAVRAKYVVTGSEIIQQNGWGFKVY